MTSKTPSSMVRMDTSNVPPPKSNTRMFFSSFSSRPQAMAAAVGSFSTRTTLRPEMMPASLVDCLWELSKQAGTVTMAFLIFLPVQLSAMSLILVSTIAEISSGAQVLVSPLTLGTEMQGLVSLSTMSQGRYFLSYCTVLSEQRLPMSRLTSQRVRVGLTVAWFLAASPISLSSSVKATTEGVIRFPSSLGMTSTCPFLKIPTHEQVVPRSMPMMGHSYFSSSLATARANKTTTRIVFNIFFINVSISNAFLSNIRRVNQIEPHQNQPYYQALKKYGKVYPAHHQVFSSPLWLAYAVGLSSDSFLSSLIFFRRNSNSTVPRHLPLQSQTGLLNHFLDSEVISSEFMPIFSLLMSLLPIFSTKNAVKPVLNESTQIQEDTSSLKVMMFDSLELDSLMHSSETRLSSLKCPTICRQSLNLKCTFTFSFPFASFKCTLVVFLACILDASQMSEKSSCLVRILEEVLAVYACATGSVANLSSDLACNIFLTIRLFSISLQCVSGFCLEGTLSILRFISFLTTDLTFSQLGL